MPPKSPKPHSKKSSSHARPERTPLRAKAKGPPKPATPTLSTTPHTLADATPTPHSDAQHALATQGLFWNNVVREMLTGLAMAQESKPELFDGRYAILTHAGERIPIAAVTPMFAMSVPGTAADRETSQFVQCTVFRIATPDGELFTLPLHEIRALHSITPELLDQLQSARGASADEPDTDEPPRPFGLAAFAALPKPGPGEPAPNHPTE